MSATLSYVIRLFWNSREGRPRALWRLLGELVLLLGLIVVLGIAFALALQPLISPGLGGSFLYVAAYGAVITLLATIASMWLSARFLDHRPFRDYGFRFDRGWWLDFGFGLLLGALLMVVIFLTELAAGWLTVVESFRSANSGQPFALGLVAAVILFSSVGTYEEMLSRGYLLHNLAEGLNLHRADPRVAVVLAWLLSSVAFGLAHASNPNATLASTGSIFVAGIFLGLGYVLTGELAVPIGLHIAWNFFQGNVFGFHVSGADFSQTTFIATVQGGPDLWTGGPFGPEGGLLGFLAMLAGSLLILLWVRFRRESVAIHTGLAEYPYVER